MLLNFEKKNEENTEYDQITPEGGVGLRVNFEPPGAHGTVHRKRLVSFQPNEVVSGQSNQHRWKIFYTNIVLLRTS